MHKFLYLTEVEWHRAWVYGGEVPISLASKYLSNERDGTRTPDETLIHDSPIPLDSLERIGWKITDNNVGLTLVNCSGFGGTPIPNLYNVNYYREDGLVLSFCNHSSMATCERFKKKCCVRITDALRLKTVIDKRLGLRGTSANCTYTTQHQRDHFLKSTEDAWQDEYRIFWKSGLPRSVLIPPQSATLEFTLP